MPINPLHPRPIGRRIKAAILDLDGTLIGPGESVSPVVDSAVRRLAQLVPVAIATGREASDVIRYAKGLGLATPQICDGGATILDLATGEHIWRRPLKPKSAQRVMERLKTMGTAFIATHRAGSFRDHSQVTHWGLTRISALDMHEEDAAELAAGFDLEDHVQTVKVFLPYNGLWAVDFTLRGVDKALAATELAQWWGVSMEDVAGAGDSYNDLPLLNACGWRIAMGNAPKDVRDIAHYLAPSVEEDGLADAIDRYVMLRV